jgi:hypothetical protein
VAGVPIPANPTGSFQIPDASINQSTPATVAIQASNIPLGTVVTLYISSENGPDMTLQTSARAGLGRINSARLARVRLGTAWLGKVGSAGLG